MRYRTLCEIVRQPAKHQHELVHTVVLIIPSKSLGAGKGSRLGGKATTDKCDNPNMSIRTQNRLLCTENVNSLGTLKARDYIGKMFLVLFLMHV